MMLAWAAPWVPSSFVRSCNSSMGIEVAVYLGWRNPDPFNGTSRKHISAIRSIMEEKGLCVEKEVFTHPAKYSIRAVNGWPPETVHVCLFVVARRQSRGIMRGAAGRSILTVLLTGLLGLCPVKAFRGVQQRSIRRERSVEVPSCEESPWSAYHIHTPPLRRGGRGMWRAAASGVLAEKEIPLNLYNTASRRKEPFKPGEIIMFLICI
jgi:hypothetical protein